MGLVATKPVFRVSVKARFQPVSSATETNQKFEILLEASSDMIPYNTRITKALISLRRCAGWSAPLLFAPPKTGFLRPRLIFYWSYIPPRSPWSPHPHAY